MLGLYLLTAVIGGGLLVFSLLAGGDDADLDVDADIDAPDFDVDAGDLDVDMADLDAGDADVDLHGGGSAAALLLGFFRPRNFIFLLTGFGLTGSVLTWVGAPPGTTLAASIGMGAGAFLLTHLVFSWLRRTDLVVDAISERDLEGVVGRVVLPLGPGEPGRIVALVADREIHVTARLAADASERIPVGQEVVILGTEDGIAEVIPFDALEPPPPQEK